MLISLVIKYDDAFETFMDDYRRSKGVHMAERKNWSQIYRKKLQVHPPGRVCTSQAEQQSNFLTKLGDVDGGSG